MNHKLIVEIMAVVGANVCANYDQNFDVDDFFTDFCLNAVF